MRRREQLTAYASLLPAFALVAILIWYPRFKRVLRFTDWNGASAAWVGMENFSRLFRSDDFWTPLRTNLIFWRPCQASL